LLRYCFALQLAIAWGELVGGIAMLVGFLTRLAALGLIAIMAGAIATVHWPHGFSLQTGGYEYNLTLIVMCLCLFLGGPGPLSIDRVFRLRRRGP
jgi:putative oxidoreductase